MKLIIIHGPPAAGKLTVANALSKRTYFKVFHNHLTIDCTEPVFEFGTAGFWEINVHLRREIIAEAARRDIDVVHTCCYAKDVDDEYYRQLVAAARDNGGEVHAVYINCRDEVRKERIGDESRVRIRKLTDPASVDRQRGENLLFSLHPDFADQTLMIDTSDISPDEAATLIIDKFGLREIDNEVP
jgi:cytidylate kinase